MLSHVMRRRIYVMCKNPTISDWCCRNSCNREQLAYRQCDLPHADLEGMAPRN